MSTRRYGGAGLGLYIVRGLRVAPVVFAVLLFAAVEAMPLQTSQPLESSTPAPLSTLRPTASRTAISFATTVPTRFILEPSESLIDDIKELIKGSALTLFWVRLTTFAMIATAFVTALMAWATARVASETRRYANTQERIYSSSHRPGVLPILLKFQKGTQLFEWEFALDLANSAQLVAEDVSVNADIWFRFSPIFDPTAGEPRRVPCSNEFGPIPVPPSDRKVMVWGMPKDVAQTWIPRLRAPVSSVECHVFTKTRYRSMNGERYGNYCYHRYDDRRGFILLAYADITCPADLRSSNGWGLGTPT
jgi:hypothetical protein